jgi:hypothetical protein
MTVKMPVLGQPTRRRSGRGWWVVLLLTVVAGGYLYRTRHRPPPPPPVPVVAPALVATPPAQVTAVAPGSPAVPATSPALPVGPRFMSVRIDGPLETAVAGGVGADLAPALTQVVKRVLVWWMAVPGDLRRGDTLDVLYEPRAGGYGSSRCASGNSSDGRSGVPPAGGGAFRASPAARIERRLVLPARWLGADHLAPQGRTAPRGVDFKTSSGHAGEGDLRRPSPGALQKFLGQRQQPGGV